MPGRIIGRIERLEGKRPDEAGRAEFWARFDPARARRLKWAKPRKSWIGRLIRHGWLIIAGSRGGRIRLPPISTVGRLIADHLD